MITKNQARAILDDVGAELISLPYAELQRLDHELTSAPDDEWRLFREVLVEGEKLSLYTLISEWGLRRRISVELIGLSEDGTIGPDNIGCVYFERFSSGKLNEGIDFIYIMLGLAVITLIAALVAIAW